MRKALTALGFLICLGPVALAGEGDGGYAAPWLQVPAGARPTAMGGAYLAVSNDGAAPLFNPAGLARLQRPMVASSYRTMSMGRQLGYLTAVSPVRGQSILGVHWLYAGSGKVDARDVDGYLVGHDLGMNSHQLAVVFAKNFERFFSIGANINYLISRFSELSVTTVGFDFGVMLYADQLGGRENQDQFPIKDLQIGLVARNFAKEFRWSSDKYDLIYSTEDVPTVQTDKVPVEIGIGVSARWLDRKLLTAADLYKNNKQGARAHFGAEYFLQPELMLRSGYSDGRFTAGTGYVFQLGKKALAIDYAFSTDRVDEGSEHIFSFDLLF